MNRLLILMFGLSSMMPGFTVSAADFYLSDAEASELQSVEQIEQDQAAEFLGLPYSSMSIGQPPNRGRLGPDRPGRPGNPPDRPGRPGNPPDRPGRPGNPPDRPGRPPTRPPEGRPPHRPPVRPPAPPHRPPVRPPPHRPPRPPVRPPRPRPRPPGYPIRPIPGYYVCFAEDAWGQRFDGWDRFASQAQREALNECEYYSAYCEPMGCRVY